MKDANIHPNHAFDSNVMYVQPAGCQSHHSIGPGPAIKIKSADRLFIYTFARTPADDY